MHRSGTSFLARALNLSGVYLGEPWYLISDEWRTLDDNPKGHWENKKFVELAERTLDYNNGAWDDPPNALTVNESSAQEITNCVNDLIAHPSLSYGFKDPRILLCLEAWLKFIPKNFVIVGIFRDPLKVAESLKKRDRFTYEKSLDLWKIYNQKLLFFLEKYDGFLLNFDWPREKLFSEITFILDKLSLDKNIDIKDWHSEELLHSDKTFQSNFPLSQEIISIYSMLTERALHNNKTKVSRYAHTPDELLEIVHGLLTDLQNQGKYFTQMIENSGISPKQMRLAKTPFLYNVSRPTWHVFYSFMCRIGLEEYGERVGEFGKRLVLKKF